MELGDTQVAHLIAALRDRNWMARLEAAQQLGQLGDPRALEPLLAALADKKALVRSGVARVLGDLGDPRALEPLLAALNDKSVMVRNQALGALGRIDDPRAERALAEYRAKRVPLLIGRLQDRKSKVRRGAALELGSLGDADAVEQLIAALEDKKAPVRAFAARAVGQLGDARGVEPLIAALADEAPGVRAAAAEALGWLGDTRAIEPLVAAHANETVEGGRGWGPRAEFEEALEALGASKPWPPAPAGNCDICRKPIPERGSARVPNHEFKELVQRGYNPVQHTGPDPEAYESWKTAVFLDTTYWDLCAACATDLRAFKEGAS